ncbi:cell surface antigen [Streptococcus anginosus]|uniref:hypothetical protein n=1 Tax=Streptococcus anginosus TaxID=1328 RepID=UPI0010CAC945|nr:hypothetical protein [Streptococcus anginosus]VTS44476.1 cell surface antigen [Streptococcus anginosus]
MKSNETKTYGSIRKIKAYGTCGVILGWLHWQLLQRKQALRMKFLRQNLLQLHQLILQLILPASQPAKTVEQQNQLNQAGQAQGNVTVQVDNSQVNQAAQAAQKKV